MLVAIAKLHGFMLAGGSAAGNRSAANRSVTQSDFSFYRGISARIKNLTRMNVNNACIHKMSLGVVKKTRYEEGDYKRPDCSRHKAAAGAAMSDRNQPTNSWQRHGSQAAGGPETMLGHLARDVQWLAVLRLIRVGNQK
jgi:hypothetical protein